MGTFLYKFFYVNRTEAIKLVASFFCYHCPEANKTAELIDTILHLNNLDFRANVQA